MTNLATKLFLAVTGPALIAAIAYAAVVGDRSGADLLVALSGGTAILAIVSALAVTNDQAPRVAPDAPAPERRNAYTESDAAPSTPWPLVSAVVVGALVLAIAAGGAWVAGAVAAGAIPLGGWLASVWRRHPSFSPRVSQRVVERLIAPIAMPVIAALGALFIAAMVSRVLLAISVTASWVTALILAMLVLAALYAISTRPSLTPGALTGLSVAAVVVMVGAGTIGANAGEREFHPHPHDHPTVEVVAKDTLFSLKRLEFPAESEVVIVFDNEDDGVYHNVAFYTSTEPDAEPLWAGRPIPHGRERYRTETPKAGTYAFVCDFHPTMTGELVITEGGADHSEHVGEEH